jgi:hypothetical protein
VVFVRLIHAFICLMEMNGCHHFGLNPAQVGAESEGPGLGRFKIHVKAGDRVVFSLWAKLKLSYRPI